jgi:hypothetical protein
MGRGGFSVRLSSRRSPSYSEGDLPPPKRFVQAG